jgi:hypothetical protein
MAIRKTPKTGAEAPTGFARTNIHNIFATDSSKEENGAWVVVNELIGLRVKIRRMRADSVVKGHEKIIREETGDKGIRRAEDLTAEKALQITKRLLAEYVLIDWENLIDDASGDEIPYSVETAMALMDIRDFRDFVYQQAQDRDSFREEADKDAEGN